jgi:hypothetical protein
MTDALETVPRKKRKSGIPTGNAGEYLVMGELLRRGFDAQIADRNTKGYDLIAAWPGQPLQRIQVKTVRVAPWFVSRSSFEEDMINEITIYVLLGAEENGKPARFFMARNSEVAADPHYPDGWAKSGFLRFRAVEQFENRWTLLRA